MADTGPFSVGEKVLVPHTDKFYEAKILKAQKREDGLWYYLLHYTGWNKKWDEWVEETGLRRPAATAGAAAAGAAPASAATGVGSSSAAQAFSTPGAAAAAAAPAQPSKKPQQKTGLTVERKRKATDAPGTAETVEVQLELHLPAQLKKQLLDQYDAIHDDGKLVPLPRRPNVMQLFQNYVAWVKEKKQESQAEEDVVMGLQVYFDKALYQCLLYRAERKQAEQALAAGQAPSAVYGAEHLLRLFVKLPELLPHTGAPEEQMQLLLRRMEDLLAYMQHQAAKIFAPVGEYATAAGAAAGQHTAGVTAAKQ